MKIEIAENIMYSYLRHVAGCRIAQTNWRTSGSWEIIPVDKVRARKLFTALCRLPEIKGIFKKNSFDQLLKQAEIDVVGLDFEESCVYGIDVAFHSAGLNYGDNKNRVIKKMLRTIFVMQCYFSRFDKYKSIFVSPVTSKKVKNEIQDTLSVIKGVINDDAISLEFISDNDFYSTIIDQLLINASNENDTMDLFLRSQRIINLDERNKQAPIKEEPSLKKPSKFNSVEVKTLNGMKIGQYVKDKFRTLIESNLLTESDFKNLQMKSFSKEVFNQNFEIFRTNDLGPFDENGYKRYYSNELFAVNFLLTSQWFEYHWDPFVIWHTKIENK